GRTGETQFDDAGRTVRTIQNYVNGTVQETDTDCDLTVDYQYDSGGRLVTLTAYNAKGSGHGVQEQATKYLYTSPINASWQTAAVYPDSDDVLSQDSTTKVWTITTDNGDHVSTAYDRLGRTTSTTDQRGVVHEYTFDTAGRLAADTVTSLGASGLVDGSIRRIGTTYDDLGRVQTVTSFSDTSGTTAVNQVQHVYNGWGKVAREYQEHDGAVDANTLHVDYVYADGASGGVARHVRLSQVTYPNGRQVQYGYGTTGAIDDIMSRLASIGDGTRNYASYRYLGAGRIAVEDYEDLEVRLDYAADDLAALDRFGRVLDQVWTDYGEDPDVVLDHYSYTYDRAGNRTSRDNELHSAFNEDYTYDGLDRLIDSDRADAFDQSWGLDGLGNFSSFDDDGTWQNRTTNAANEITGITGTWIDPTYDDAGNMISGPKTGNETTRLHHVYDAWNRQTAVYEDDGDGTFEPGTDDDLVAAYEYDGANRRIEKTFADDTGVEYYYNHHWQMLEERVVDDEGIPTAINQYVWSARYIDSPVVRFHDANADGDLLDAGDNTRYYTGDANYNVTATIDAATGDVVDRHVYAAYGTATIYDGDWSNPTAPTTDGPLYCGYFFDAETALHQVRNRYYDSSLSIFISRDPIGFEAGDVNLYRYVGNVTTYATDPFGRDRQMHGCGHGWIQVDHYDSNGNRDGYYILEFSLWGGYRIDGPFPGTVTDSGWPWDTCREGFFNSTREQDEALVQRWRDLENRRLGAPGWWGVQYIPVFWDCNAAAQCSFDYGIPDPPVSYWMQCEWWHHGG
ncbi:MAG: RHS repeat-associated core domain-containing protein, partial [Thermoguttaceae bacterium]|nr:RHS repeat-associated core domain-containing protein [Thermoguttaceae bacterium]